MSGVIPAPVRDILERGSFCHVAATTPSGPHVTPMVFVAAVTIRLEHGACLEY